VSEEDRLNAARTLPLAGLLLAVPALLLWRCTQSTPPQAPEPSNAPEPSPTVVALPAASPGAALALAPPSASGASTAPNAAATPPDDASAAPSATTAPSGARIITAVANSDPRDLELLTSIERELKRDPPPSVHELIQLRKSGMSADALRARARELPDSDLPLRILVLRWVDSISAAAPGAAARPPQPATSGTAPSPVHPIRPKAP
jgi:hypothetical protein